MKTQRFLARGIQFFLLLLLLLTPGRALAQDSTPAAPLNPELISDDSVNAIAKGMYCPVCENVPLDVCGTQACHQWRELIRQKLAEGWSEEEIKAYFAQQYGDRVLEEPPRRGLNWLVYVLPPLIVLGGLVLVVQVMRTWHKSSVRIAGSADPTPPAEDEYVRRLEEELQRRG